VNIIYSFIYFYFNPSHNNIFFKEGYSVILEPESLVIMDEFKAGEPLFYFTLFNLNILTTFFLIRI